MAHDSDRPIIVPSGLYPTDKSLGAVWEAQRAQAGQMAAVLNASGYQARKLSKQEERLDEMDKTLEAQDKRIDGIDKTIARWSGVILGATVVIQIAFALWNHYGH